MAKNKNSENALNLTKLKERVLGLTGINPTLVLNNGTSVEAGQALVSKLETAMDEYTLMKSALAEKAYQITQLSLDAAAYSAKIFVDVKSQFGDDSLEYGKVGGIRKSQRAKPGAAAKKAAKKNSKKTLPPTA